MIKTRKELKECVTYEKMQYSYAVKNKKDEVLLHLRNDHLVPIRKYLKLLRYSQYHYNNRNNLIHSILYLYYERKKNKIGNKLGFFMSGNSFDKGLLLYHHGGIIINDGAEIGENCKLHGNNCIGNDGKNLDVPKIGNNVDIGFGACIIGGVYIADNVTIGAGAIVTKSCYHPGATLVGVPARCIFKEN